MTNKVAVEAISVCKSEERRISLCKYHLVDKLNFSSTQHSVVLFVSSVFSHAILHFNSTSISFPSIDDSVKIMPFDIVTVEKLSSEFIKELHDIKVTPFIIDYFNAVIEKMLNVLDSKLNR
jgi:hypothetical protein